MQTTLEHLTPLQKARLTVFLGEIIKAIQPEKIICYGYRITSQYHWQCFTGEKTGKEHIIYDLLVIPNSDDQRNDHEILDVLDKIVYTHISATCIVYKLELVNNAIEKNARFFNSLYFNGVMLHNATNTKLAAPEKEYTLQNHVEAAEQAWSRMFTKAMTFYNGAAYYQSVSVPEQVVFSLHQAIEQMAMALLKALTGYRPDTHNLLRLLALLEQTGLNTLAIFPGNTPEEKALLQTLKNAYSQSRYAENYTVSAELAAILYNRVGLLLKEAASLYQQQIESWQSASENEITFPLSIAFINTLNPAS
jgi:HEPN domain-containing protein